MAVKKEAAQGAQIALSPKAIAALSSYYEKKAASGKDVWEQAVPKGQYNVRPFSQPAVTTGDYQKPADPDAKELAKELGCDIEGDVAHVHVQLVRADGSIAAKATMRELAQEMGLDKTNVKQMFTQPYTMECKAGDIQKRVSRAWTIN